MTTKLYQLTALLCTIVAIVLFSSCAEEHDSTLLEEPEEAETQTIEEIAPPEPDWVDGVVTITVGRFKTKGEMLRELYSSNLLKRDMPSIKGTILNKNFSITPPEKGYTIEVAVMTMLEMGITEPAAIKEIKAAYWEKGYGPLTEEEAIELFLQLKDQPNSATGHRMNNFRVFLTEESKKTFFYTPFAYLIQHNKIENVSKTYRRMCRTLVRHPFDPNQNILRHLDNNRLPGVGKRVISSLELPTRFATVIRGSIQRR